MGSVSAGYQLLIVRARIREVRRDRRAGGVCRHALDREGALAARRDHVVQARERLMCAS